MNAEAGQLISRLGLLPLAREGGFFASAWTSTERLPNGRPCASAILFLLTTTDFSAFHRLGMEEIWHFHAGDPVELVLLDPASGSGRAIVLGPEVTRNHAPHAVVTAGTWQGARLDPAARDPRGWALLGCTVAPAWDEREFELGRRPELLGAFPADAGIITALTR
jgi:hypothetical protein